jgi:hypothetical protein
LVPLGPSAAVVPRVLPEVVCDAGLTEAVAEDPVTPVQVVVIVGTSVEQDAGQLPEVVEAVVNVDDRVEAQPAIPDILEQFAAGMRHGEVDVEGWLVRIR